MRESNCNHANSGAMRRQRLHLALESNGASMEHYTKPPARYGPPRTSFNGRLGNLATTKCDVSRTSELILQAPSLRDAKSPLHGCRPIAAERLSKRLPPLVSICSLPISPSTSRASFLPAMSVLLESLRVLTTCSSVLLNVSPWPEFARINRQRTPGPLTVLPVVMLFCNSFLWTIYGFLVGQLFPLFFTCSMGQCTCAGFIAVYYRWSPDRPAVRRLLVKAGSVMACCMLYVILGIHGYTNQPREQVITTLALMCISANICLYASPLDTMKRVVQTKSAASLPISLCTVNLVNGLLWVAFGITEGDYYVLTPNAIGSVLSAAQVALYFTYCNTDESRQEEKEIQAAAAALENVTKIMSSASSYGSLNSFVPHTYHSVVDVHAEKESLLVAAAN